MESTDDFVKKLYDPAVRDSKETCLYAVYSKAGNADDPNNMSNYAGIASLNNTNPTNAVTELGVIIFPDFRGTKVTTHAIGLLLMWTLDPPSAGGLGLRRVEWFTHADNLASRRFALRLGFVFEGVARWQRVHPYAEWALPVDELRRRNGTEYEAPGRHTANYSIVWDEWEETRRKVKDLMEHSP